jgi:aryl carrier-like protein
MPTGLAMDVLGLAAEADPGAIVVADFDWPALCRWSADGRLSPLLRDLPDCATPEDPALEDPALATQAPPATDTALRQRLSGADRQQRRHLLLDLLGGEAAGVLGYASQRDLDPDGNLLELGFSSFTALELNNRLHAALGLKVPIAAVYDHPTLRALAAYLADLLDATSTGTTTGDPTDNAPAADEAGEPVPTSP